MMKVDLSANARMKLVQARSSILRLLIWVVPFGMLVSSCIDFENAAGTEIFKGVRDSIHTITVNRERIRFSNPDDPKFGKKEVLDQLERIFSGRDVIPIEVTHRSRKYMVFYSVNDKALESVANGQSRVPDIRVVVSDFRVSFFVESGLVFFRQDGVTSFVSDSLVD